tara:strand:+ start:354 stop:1232 length:879 start_codon:yes stop_codon:yes gene_type:complete
MKKLLLILLCLPMIGFGQHSNYYNVDHNINANINKNVNVSGTVRTTKTIKTIDYGQLALANAEREKNRLANIKYADDKQRLMALEIASNPVKAYDYGISNTWNAKKSKVAKNWGFKKFVFKHKIPHKSLFTKLQDYNYQNISENNIVTEIEINTPFYVQGMKNEELIDQKTFLIWKEVIDMGAENWAKGNDIDWQVGTKNKGDYLHKVDVNKTKVYGVNGFLSTLIYENDYEYVIEDNFYAIYDGIVFIAGVRYKGDKDEITFEDLEGRRHYFKRLCNQIISTGSFYDYMKY